MNSPPSSPPGPSRRFWPRAALLALLFLWPLLFLVISYAGWDVFQEWRQNGLAWEASKERLRAWLESLGPLAPVGFILLQALQVVVAPIPGEATGFLGGFLFGALPGFVYASLGLTLGSTLAFMVSRRLGARIMNRLTGTGRFEKFDALFEKNGALIALLLFLFPGAPKDYFSFLLGLTTMPFKVFVVLVTLGRMPATLMLTLQGAQVYQGNYWTFFILLGITLGAGGLLIVFRERFYRCLRLLGGPPAG